jgi:hypothetical protein
MLPKLLLKRAKPRYPFTLIVALLLVLGILSGSFGQVRQTFYTLSTALTDSLALVGRAEVPLTALRAKRTMVALVFGQSNSANSGETRYRSGPGVYSFYRGKLYRARDPLLGATGRGGSVWTRLGDKLISKRAYDAVVFVPLGVGATSVARWTAGGDLHEKLLSVLREVETAGLTITHLLWHQGESDARRTSTHIYKTRFREMVASIREHGVNAPVYVSLATRCYKGPDETIRQAQRELPELSQGIYAGPDTDTLGPRYRYDGCYFSTEGLEKFAELWLEVLVPN